MTYNTCEHLVKIHDVYMEKDDFICLVMDYYESTDLHNFIKRKGYLTEKFKLNLFLKILIGLQYLHQNRIIHRDIKLQNIMIHKNEPYIGDFGTCNILPHEKIFTSTCIGTLCCGCTSFRMASV